MNSNRPLNLHNSYRETIDFGQPQSIEHQCEKCQVEPSQYLRENRTELEWFRRLYESLPCICFTLDSRGNVLWVSQFGAAYLGYEALELIQKPIASLFHGEDRVKCQEKLAELQQQPSQTNQWSIRLIGKNDNIIWVKAIACLVPGTQANPIISLVCEDITASKEMEEALRSSEELYRSTLEHISDTVFITNDTGEFTFICPNVEIIFGYSLPEVRELGNISQLLGESLFDRDKLETYGEIRNIEREMTDKAGRRHTLLINVKGVAIAGGTVLYSCRDITERKQVENELKQYRHNLECRVAERTAELVRINEQLQQEITERQATLRERKQAEQALQQQYLRERLVGAIAQRIHQSLDLEEILHTTVAEVRKAIASDRVLIFRIHPDGSGVVVVESVDPEWIPISGTRINDRYFAQSYIQLYRQGRVQSVENIYAAGLTQCHIDLLAQFQVRANLVVPIVQEEKLWGLLVAQQCKETRQWQSWEIDLLKSLATQAGIAIQQSELYQQAQNEITQRQQAEEALRQQFQRERLIGAITQRIRQSLNLKEILERTVAEVRQVLGCDRVIIFQFEPDWSGNVVVESVDERWLSILGTNIYDPCFKQEYILPYQRGRVKAIEDIHTANLGQCHSDLLAQFQVRANLVVPILQSEQTIQNLTPLAKGGEPGKSTRTIQNPGRYLRSEVSSDPRAPKSKIQNRLWGLLIAHQCSGSRQWQENEIGLLCALASQVAIAIQQSQLYEQAKSHAKREQALNQVTQVIRSSLDLNTIFSTAVHEIGSLLQVDRALILQYIPERKLWLHVSEYNKHLDLPVNLGTEISDENNTTAERLKRLEIVKIDDTDTLEDEINQGLAQTNPGAWLMVPLHFGSQVWGSIALGRDSRPYHWQESEVELICEVADQLAIALQQAELYEQSRTATAKALTQAQQLEQTLEKLQKTQTQLVHNEKMSSLGQLVAGVAHEINNPVNFIYANLTYASEYTQDILSLLKLYQQQYPAPTPEIWSEIVRIDLDFLLEDLPKLLCSMKVGAERICEIVHSLRNFSRLSEAEVKPVDLHEGLDSTLVILQNRLKPQPAHPGIEVIKEYGDLPKVECYAGQLNQVFMNIITNAIDAMEEQNQTRTFKEIEANPNTIRLQTQLLNSDTVEIRIADNGPGMSDRVKAKLFDPFFTTKPVGVGTGLGLSISYQIVVEKHGGQLHCFSELGQGTEFAIQIPLRQGEE